MPAGVNERDVELFTVSQETAKNFLIQVKKNNFQFHEFFQIFTIFFITLQENSRGKFHSSSSSEVPSNVNTTCKQTADTNTTTDNKVANTEAIGAGNVTKEHNKDHGVPSQIAVPHLSSTAPGSAARYIIY